MKEIKKLFLKKALSSLFCWYDTQQKIPYSKVLPALLLSTFPVKVILHLNSCCTSQLNLHLCISKKYIKKEQANVLTLFSLTFLFQTSFDSFLPERERGVCANTCSPHQAWLNNFSAVLSFWWTENYQLYWIVTNTVFVCLCVSVCGRKTETIISDDSKIIFTFMTQSSILIPWNTNAALISN